MYKVFKEYENMDSFRDDCSEDKPMVYKGVSERSSNRKSYDFSMANTYQEADNLFLNGWTEGAEKIKHIELSNDDIGVLNARTTLEPSVAGCVPIVPAVLAGHPQSMYMIKKTKGLKPVLDIYVNIAASGGVDAQSMLNRGAALLGLIDGIEATGTRVGIKICFCNSGKGKKYAFSVQLKRPEDNLNAIDIAYAVAHPAFLRRHGFRWIENNFVSDNSGYGTAQDINKEDINGFYVPCMGSDYGYETGTKARNTLLRMYENYQTKKGN